VRPPLAPAMVALSYALTVFPPLSGNLLALRSGSRLGAPRYAGDVHVRSPDAGDDVVVDDSTDRRFQSRGRTWTKCSVARLFTEIQQIASDLREPMPAEVCAIADVNAAVAERGGFLGFGNAEVLAVGLRFFSAHYRRTASGTGARICAQA